jgi:hypothetical protein
MSKNRAFVRYNKKGILAPGSLVVTKNYPDRSQNLWYEVPTRLLGSTITLKSSIDNRSFPWVNNPSARIALNMGCMSNHSEYINMYTPFDRDITNISVLASVFNSRYSFLGTFEVGGFDPEDSNYQYIEFNLSPQLMSSLVQPEDASPNFCGFSITFNEFC